MPTPITGISSYNIDPAESSQSLQAYIELVYNKEANGVIVSNLASLNQSLGLTQQTLDVLATLQSMKNFISVAQAPQIPAFLSNIALLPFIPGAGTTATKQEHFYEANASAYFNQLTNFNIVYPPTKTSTAWLQSFLSATTQLSTMIKLLKKNTPTDASRNIDPNSLLAKAENVYNDIRNKGIPSTGGMYNSAGVLILTSTQIKAAFNPWVIDNYRNATPGVSTGQIQQNLTNAITAAQSLNTTQSSSIQNYLLLFQEFYKSAAALITAINQIITQIATAIKQ